jgi:hypothetical protein
MSQYPNNDRSIPSTGELDYHRRVEALLELIVEEELAKLKEPFRKHNDNLKDFKNSATRSEND